MCNSKKQPPKQNYMTFMLITPTTLFKINMLKPLLLLLIMILQTALVHFHSILSIAAVHFAFCTRITRKGLA